MNEEAFPPFQVYVHYLHKLLSDPSKICRAVDSPEEAADLILRTLDSYKIDYQLDKETILSAIPKKKFRRAKQIKWEFFPATRDHVEVIIEDTRECSIKKKSACMENEST